jgi:hypothetical protein
MPDFLFRYFMNVSTEAHTFPINQQHYHRGLTSHSSMFVNASPIAVSNKIRAIQTRKSRITLQSYYDYTDVRPINVTQRGGITSSSGTFSQITPEKLVERSKDVRLGRTSTRQNPRPSLLSRASPVEHSLVWPGFNSPTMLAKQPQVNSPTITPTALGPPPINKPTAGHMPDIHQHLSRAHTTTRQPLIEQQNSLAHVERHKSLPKTKSSIPKAYHRTMSKSKSPFTITRTQPLQLSRNDSKQRINNVHMYESEEDDGNNLIMDEEFEEYREKAIIKCADWLIKHVFDKKYDENND